MEAAGLAVGVVSLGLDLATRLQAYIEGVQGAGDRLREVTADVSATASIVMQLADLLDADKAAGSRQQTKIDTIPLESARNSHATILESLSPVGPISQQQPVFSAKGIVEVEAVLRRCDQAYKVLVRVLVSATSESFSRTQKVLSSAGLSDLTAARLARLTSRAKWPWLEPRIKACQKQLRSIKVDLLLSLNIASLAKCRHSPSDNFSSRAEEDAALRSFTENLMLRRDDPSRKQSSIVVPSPRSKATISHHSNSSDIPPTAPASEPVVASTPALRGENGPGRYQSSFETLTAPDWNQPPTTVTLLQASPGQPHSFRRNPLTRDWEKPPPLGDRGISTERPQTPEGGSMSWSNVYVDSHETSTVGDIRESADELPTHPLQDVPGHGEDIPMGTLLYRHGQDTSNLQAWFLCRNDSGSNILKVPVRDQGLTDVLRDCEQGPPIYALPRFLSLTAEQKEAVLEVFDYSRHRDDLNKTLVAIYSRSTTPELPTGVEVLVVLRIESVRETVELVDMAGCVWKMPFYSFKTALIHAKKESDLEAEVLRRCNSTAHRGNVRLFTQNTEGYFYSSVDSRSPPTAAAISFATLRDILRPGTSLLLDIMQPQSPSATQAAPAERYNAPTRPVSVKQSNPYSLSQPQANLFETIPAVYTGGSGIPKRESSNPKSTTSRKDDWTDVTDPVERRRLQNRVAQRKFRERTRENKEKAARNDRNEEHAGRGYSIPSTADLDDDPESQSGLPWGGLTMQHIVSRDQLVENRGGSGQGDYIREHFGDDWPPYFDFSEMYLGSRRESDDDVLKELFGDEVIERETGTQVQGVDNLLSRWTTVREGNELS